MLKLLLKTDMLVLKILIEAVENINQLLNVNKIFVLKIIYLLVNFQIFRNISLFLIF